MAVADLSVVSDLADLAGLPAPPARLAAASPGGVWPTVFYAVNVAWIVIFVTLALGRYRAARVLAMLGSGPLT